MSKSLDKKETNMVLSLLEELKIKINNLLKKNKNLKNGYYHGYLRAYRSINVDDLIKDLSEWADLLNVEVDDLIEYIKS
jgi:hypothetical protein